jgi:hypothetical protein
MSGMRRVQAARKRTGRRSARRGRSLVLALSLAVAVLVGIVFLPAAALAAPIALDAPDNGTPPLVAYDPVDGTTYVAWTDPHLEAVDLCVLPPSASGCEGGAPVLLEDSKFTGDDFAGLGGLVVLPGGEVVVIGTPTSTGSVAWASPAGGAAFLASGHGLQNGGNLISPVSLFYSFDNAVALSSTEVGLLDDSDHFYSFFSDSPLTSESPAISASGNSNSGGQYPGKAEDTNGPEIAAEPAPAPAPAGTDIVVGVGSNNSAAQLTPPGCLNDAASGYGVSVGKASGTSKAAGTLNAEGLPPYQLLECSAEAPVLASGGGAGIGVLEEQGSGVSGAGSDYTLDYRPFDATATGGSFGPPVELSDVTEQVLDGVDALDVSEDSGTGVYAMWEDGQGTVIDYSANGGANWGGQVVAPPPYGGHDVIAGVGGGNAVIAWNENPGTGEQVFIEVVNYQALLAAATAGPTPPPAADTVTTVQTSGSNSSASLEISAGTVGETDRATINGTNGSVAGGTVTYTLYNSPSCAASSRVFVSGAAAVVGGVAAASSPITAALVPGVYYWQATYSGDAKNVASTSTCGSEVLTVVPASKVGGSGTSNGASVTLTITCASTPCTVTVTITISEASASAARKGKKHPKSKIVTIASGTFTIHTKGPQKLSVRLTKAGKKLLASHHGHLGAKVLVADKTAGGIEKTTRSITITTVKPKHKHKK